MTASEALSIVRALADGRDPRDGQPLSTPGVLGDADVVRALHVAVSALERLERRQQRDGQLPQNAGKPWSDEEDRQLCEAFDTGSPIADLAARQHHRSDGAIRSRLQRLGRLITK